MLISKLKELMYNVYMENKRPKYILISNEVWYNFLYELVELEKLMLGMYPTCDDGIKLWGLPVLRVIGNLPSDVEVV